VGNRGFVFLFNPDARRLSARVRLDESIGFRGAGRYVIRELYPLEGMRLGKPGVGFWSAGDVVPVSLDGGSARVLEIVPTAALTAPLVFNAPSRATIANGVLDVRDVRGEVGSSSTLTVVVPRGAAVSLARVNGTDIPIRARRGDVIELGLRFDGIEFRRLQPAILGDSAFAGGKLSGTFTIPKLVFDQLAARRRAWPIPWTPEDSLTTWLVPERLLLYAQFAEPNDKWDVRLTIDGRPVELRKAYTAVRVVPSTFVGFYADASRLEPDRVYRFELDTPPLRPGQFWGLFFENVEPEYTTAVRSLQ
jgi:hypothetical protein